MIELITDPTAWVAFATLTVLELVLGIDNLVFISIVAERLPQSQQKKARQTGLLLALLMRLVLLFFIAWIVGLTDPVFSVAGKAFSWRDLILLIGGTFLLGKATLEINHAVDGDSAAKLAKGTTTFFAVLSQIVLLDLVFSLDSILTAVGLTSRLPIMVSAVIVSMAIMVWAAEPVSAFVKKHLSVKLLALAFLLLIAVVLIAEGFHVHIPKGYIYFSVGFAMAVQTLTLVAKSRREKKAETGQDQQATLID